ncbi:MAG: LysM peptidoglycan-binding domain-containing protein [Xenococcaceae cyanobacterium]
MDLNITRKSIKSGLKSAIFGAELAKITIERELGEGAHEVSGVATWGTDYKNLFEDAPDVLFNPNQIHLTKKTRWNRALQNSSNTGELQFAGGEPANYTIDLFFNTYEDLSSAPSSIGGKIKQAGLRTLKDYATPSSLFAFFEPPVSVRQYTDKVRELMEIDPDLKRPPRCKLSWGQFGTIIVGYLKELTELFTLFLPDGTPVRATLTCTFEQDDPQTETKSGTKARDDDPVRIVRRGETLSSIAYQEYSDPSLWREIARANRIDNPRSLQPGQVLIIPVLHQ